MRTGLEGHVHGGAVDRLPRGLDRDDLGMGFTGAPVPALADHAAVLRDHATDAGIRRAAIAAPLGQDQRPLHERQLRTAPRHFLAPRALLFFLRIPYSS